MNSLTNRLNTIQKLRENIRSDCINIVQHPGKFESEPLYAPYFYNLETTGSGDPLYGDWRVHKLETIDHYIFPELDGITIVKTLEDHNGFFYILVVEKGGENVGSTKQKVK